MVEFALEEFYNLSLNGLYKMAVINKWLTKYHSLFHNLSQLHSKMYLIEIDKSLIRLPPLHLKPSKETQFLDLYTELNTINNLHQREKYFQSQVKIFSILKSNSEIKKWLEKNERLGTEEFVCFEIDYLDYDEECYHLQIINPSKMTESISIERDEFKYTLQFLKTFNDNYYG